jgi:hypothetical protein
MCLSHKCSIVHTFITAGHTAYIVQGNDYNGFDSRLKKQKFPVSIKLFPLNFQSKKWLNMKLCCVSSVICNAGRLYLAPQSINISQQI